MKEEKRMKRLLGLLMAVMVMMGGISCAVAENANPIVSDWLTELKSKRLIQIVEDEIGEGWTLYQPNGREEEENFSSAANLKEMRFLPVVAQKDNQLRLLILRRQGDLWKVSEQNDRALMRDGWMLQNFSAMPYGNSDSTYIYFDFVDENQTEWGLVLNLSTVYVSYFRMIYNAEGYGTTEIVFNYDRGMKFQFDAPFYFRLSYDVDPAERYSFVVEDFDLATCPLSMQDFFVPAVVSCEEEGAGLYIMAKQGIQPILVLADGEKIEAIPQKEKLDWTIVYYQGNYLFIKTENCKMKE